MHNLVQAFDAKDSKFVPEASTEHEKKSNRFL
jgi:hypothetical protein